MKPPRLHDKARWLAHLDEALVAGAELEEAWYRAWTSGPYCQTRCDSIRRATRRNDRRLAVRVAACFALGHMTVEEIAEFWEQAITRQADSAVLWLALPAAARVVHWRRYEMWRRAGCWPM